MIAAPSKPKADEGTLLAEERTSLAVERSRIAAERTMRIFAFFDLVFRFGPFSP